MTIFDETPKKGPQGAKATVCPIPGCQEPRAVEVRVQLMEGPNASMRKRGVGARSISRSRSYCQRHGEQEFADLLKTGGFTL